MLCATRPRIRNRHWAMSISGAPLASRTGHFLVRDWAGGSRLARSVSGLAMVPMKVARCGRFQKVAHIFCAGAFLASPVISQVLMTGSETGGSVRLFASDAAILEAGETRKDIPCTVTPIKQPILGFDLKFHAGYEVSVPLKELAGSDNH